MAGEGRLLEQPSAGSRFKPRTLADLAAPGGPARHRAGRRISRATLRNVEQGLFFAFVYNVIGVLIAAGVLYPAFGVLPSPMLAAAATSLSSASVIANATRLRRLVL